MKVKVNLSLDHKSASEILVEGNHFVSSINANTTTFVAPHPTTAQVAAALTALQNAEIAAQGGGVALTEVMHQKLATTKALLSQLGLYVEATANDPSVLDVNRVGIILAGGMAVKNQVHHQANIFHAKHGEISGTVELYAKGEKAGTHNWEYAIDPINNNWQHAPSSTQSHVTITGLQSGSLYHFRHRTVTKTGEGAWENPVSLLVI